MKEDNNSNDNLQPKVTDQQINKNSDVKEMTSNFKVSSQKPIKNKRNKTLLIGTILIIIAVIAGISYYFGYFTKADQIYKRLVRTSINSYTNKLKNSDYKTSKTSIKVDTSINTNSEEIDEKILDLINNVDINVDIQTDIENKEIIANLKSSYDEQDLLNIKMYSELNNKKTYIYLKELLNKYMETEKDEEFYTIYNELLDIHQMTQDEKLSLQKAINILENELINVIKKEYCFAKKENIKINDKTIETTKNAIKMTVKQLKEELTTVFSNLKDNKEFLNCFDDEDKIYNSLESLIKELEEIKDDDSTIEVNIYTNGLLQQVAKIDIIVYSQETEQNVTITVTRLEDNIYSFEILSDEENNNKIKGILTTKNKNKNEGIVKLEIEIKDFGKIEFNIDYSQKFNEQIDTINIQNSVKLNELTSENQKSLMVNFQKSKLYELIKDLIQ